MREVSQLAKTTCLIVQSFRKTSTVDVVFYSSIVLDSFLFWCVSVAFRSFRVKNHWIRRGSALEAVPITVSYDTDYEWRVLRQCQSSILLRETINSGNETVSYFAIWIVSVVIQWNTNRNTPVIKGLRSRTCLLLDSEIMKHRSPLQPTWWRKLRSSSRYSKCVVYNVASMRHEYDITWVGKSQQGAETWKQKLSNVPDEVDA